MRNKLKYLFATTIIAGSFGISGAAQAQTAANTIVTNTVTVDYQVGGVDQNQLSAVNDFTVDRVIAFELVEFPANGPTFTSAGDSDVVTSFRLTNNSNDILDFNLATLQLTGGADTFDVTNLRLYLDVNGDGLLDAGDTNITGAPVVDNLGITQSRSFLIVGDIPLTQVDGDRADVQLTATERNSDGTAIVDQTADPNGEDTVETVLDTANIVRTAIDGYLLQVPRFDGPGNEPAKYSFVVSDPVIGVASATTFPKAIPGATVEYCITVTNTGSAAGNNIRIRDTIPANVTVVENSLFVAGLNGPAPDRCSTTGATQPGIAAGATAIDVLIPTVGVNETRNVVFQVTID